MSLCRLGKSRLGRVDGELQMGVAADKLRRAVTGEVEHSSGDSVSDFTGMMKKSE